MVATADKIAKLKATLAKLEEAHKHETTEFKKVAKAHRAEGKKVHAKALGKVGKEKLKKLHEAETDALEHALDAHADETRIIKAVKKMSKGAPAHIFKSAEAHPAHLALPAPPAIAEILKKRVPAKAKEAAVAAEGPAPPAIAEILKKKRGRPAKKLTPPVEPGLIPAELAGEAPKTGPQEKKAPKKSPKKAEKASKEVKIVAPSMGEKAEKKPRKEHARVTAGRKLIEAGTVTKENAKAKIKEAQAAIDALVDNPPVFHHEDDRADYNNAIADAKERLLITKAAANYLKKKA